MWLKCGLLCVRAMDSAALVCKLHGDLLRFVAEKKSLYIQGLRAAASHLRRTRGIPNTALKKLVVGYIGATVEEELKAACAAHGVSLI